MTREERNTAERRRRHTRYARHRDDVDNPIPHGLNGYSNYGCRCWVCSDARSQKWAES